MNEAERKAVSKANQFYNQALGRVIESSPLRDMFMARSFTGPKGEAVEFALRGNQNTYNYLEGPNGAMFCWTPWKSTNGWYYAWTYKPYGKGSRSGKPRNFKSVDKTRYRKRKLVQRFAVRRYIKAGGEDAEGWQDWIDKHFPAR